MMVDRKPAFQLGLAEAGRQLWRAKFHETEK
jgi:hypothetical protein